MAAADCSAADDARRYLMFRCSTRSLSQYSMMWWLCAGAALAVATVPVVARAQDAATQERLDRLERDLNMLQRQVYRGGAPTMPAPPGGGGPGGGQGSTSAADIEIRMERLEAQMRDLTGKVEEVNNGLDQLRQRVEQINSDFDVRFNQMSGGTTSGPVPGRPGAAGPPPAANPPRFAEAPSAGGLMPPGTVVPPPSGGGGGLNPIFNTLSPPGTPGARTLPPPAPPPEAGAEPPPSGGSINEQFNHAFGLVKQADYANAEVALRAFIDAHPNEALAGNAQYWLGQTYFARNKFPEAASAFAEGYKRFPKGTKAPEDLLYLGMSLAKADQKKNACVALEQLGQAFPNAAPAVRDRAAAEKKRIGCG
jgi:tol-pal system protein YbgF